MDKLKTKEKFPSIGEEEDTKKYLNKLLKWTENDIFYKISKRINYLLSFFTEIDGSADGFGPVSYIDFDTTYEDGVKEARMQWNSDDGTPEVGMPGGSVVGQILQELLSRATNDEVDTITNGTLVYVSGTTGTNVKVKRASNNDATGPQTVGMATEDIVSGQKGYVTQIGKVRDVDTGSFSGGDILWLDTNGAYTNVRPTAPITAVVVGIVERSHATEGVIQLKIIVQPRLSLLSDVFVSGIVNDQILAWDSGDSRWENKTATVDIPISLDIYDPSPARSSESNVHGGLLSLATGQPLDSVPTDIVVSKGIGKILVVVNAGSDLVGDITITGTSVDRETGVATGADTDTLTIDAITTDGSTTDSNGNTVHSFTGAYITSKWFTGTVTLSTANLTLTDVDVYHISFEQFNDSPNITIDTFDANIFTTNVNAEFDAYLYDLHIVGGDKCDIENHAGLHVGADGETAIANKYWRLRRGNINEQIDGTTDGIWADVHYSNSPAYVEDVTLKIWATKSQSLTIA